MREFAPGVQLVTSAPVVASRAATRYRLTPLTWVNEPATKIREPSAEATIARPPALRLGAHEEISAPVLRSNARMFDRGVSFVPAGLPAGRAEVNSPVT